MRKNLSKIMFAVLAIFILPLMLTGCDEVKYFSIDVSSNSLRRGTVVGPDRTSKIAEGTSVTLNAIKNTGEFVCWIKNSIEVASIEENYTFNVNENTQGSYVGVFTRQYWTQMHYAALTNAKINISGVTNYNASIKIVNASAGTEERELFNGQITEQTATIYNGQIISFLNEDRFVANVTIDYTFNDQPQQHVFPNIQLSKNDFIDESITVTSQDNLVTLTFQKLSRQLVESLTQN